MHHLGRTARWTRTVLSWPQETLGHLWGNLGSTPQGADLTSGQPHAVLKQSRNNLRHFWGNLRSSRSLLGLLQACAHSAGHRGRKEGKGGGSKDINNESPFLWAYQVSFFSIFYSLSLFHLSLFEQCPSSAKAAGAYETRIILPQSQNSCKQKRVVIRLFTRQLCCSWGRNGV